jgi:putative PIN family toxin of toxin-antitoxin system
MLKAVLDANVFVSSLLVRVGQPARVLRAWREQQYLLITSPAIIAETEATLNYPRIRQKYAITDEDIEQLVALLKRDALLMPGNAQVAGSSLKIRRTRRCWPVPSTHRQISSLAETVTCSTWRRTTGSPS